MKRVAILYICTGKYFVLWEEFYKSFEEKFLKDCSKEYFVFTDNKTLEYGREKSVVHFIEQEALKWPYSTLMRFHLFNNIADELSKFDYIFFFNANSYAVNEITGEMILPGIDDDKSICVVKHPAYRNCKPFEFPYDRNYKCRAYIPYGRGKIYVQGSLIGGTAEGFLNLSHTIAGQIDKDLKKNVIALWHDESYLNKYILTHKNYRLLDIRFANCVTDDPQKAIIHLRPKERYFDLGQVKSDADATDVCKINAFFNGRIYSFLHKKEVFKSDYRVVKKANGVARAFVWGIKNVLKVII